MIKSKGSLTSGVFFLLFAVFGVIIFVRDGSKTYLLEGIMAVIMAILLLGGNRVASGFGAVLNASVYLCLGLKNGLGVADVILTLMFLILGTTIMFSYKIRQKSALWIAVSVLAVVSGIFGEDGRKDIFEVKGDYFLFVAIILATYWSVKTFGIEKKRYAYEAPKAVSMYEPEKEAPVTQENLGEELKNIIREHTIDTYEILDADDVDYDYGYDDGEDE